MVNELHLTTIAQSFDNAAAFLEAHDIAYGTDYTDAGDRHLDTHCQISAIACCCTDGALQVGVAQALGLTSLADLFGTPEGLAIYDGAAEIAREHASASTGYRSHVEWNDGARPRKTDAIRFLNGCQAAAVGYQQNVAA